MNEGWRGSGHTQILGEAKYSGPSYPTVLAINTGQLLDEQVQQQPHKFAVVSRWQGVRLTYADLHIRCQQLARGLIRLGVRPGDRVAVLAGNSSEYVQLFFAITAIGAWIAILNPTLTISEIEGIVRFINPHAVFVTRRIGYRSNKALLEKLGVEGPGAAEDSVLINIGSHETHNDDIKGVIGFEDLFEGIINGDRSDPLSEVWAKPKADDVCCLQFTSGTTGPRKASMSTHRNLIANAQFVGDGLLFTPEDVVCCPPPLAHCFGLVCGLLAAVAHGSSIVLPADIFDAAATTKAVEEEGCSVLHAVPVMFQAILKQPQTAEFTCRVRLRTGIVAGSSLSQELVNALYNELHLVDLRYGFGMTETSCISFMTPYQWRLIDDFSSIGTIGPHASAKVIDESGATVAPGVAGELCISGYLIHKGYFANREKSEEILSRDETGAEWLHTGDTVTLDKAGYCRFAGRQKDLIKRGGENIAPADIETLLVSHESVAAAAVVGVKDPMWGEAICAFVEQVPDTLREGVTDRELKSWLRKQKLEPHKIPQHFLRLDGQNGLPSTIPVNSTGKILKAELRDLAIQQIHINN